jgi:lysophospholipase L1-like esterase
VIAAVLGAPHTPAAATVAGPTGPAPTAAAGNRVLLVGDSILVDANQDVTARLRADGWDPVVAAAAMTNIDFWTHYVPPLVIAHRPDVLVVELGTNDCNTVCRRVTSGIDRIIRAVPPRTPVYWLNVQTQATYPRHAGRVNARLNAASRRFSRLHVVDMDTRLRDHPEWHEDDGVHLNEAGSLQLAALISESI